MNVFDFALKIELDSEKYYRELAAQAEYQELKVVLEGLADDEQRRYKSYLAADPAVSKARNSFEPGMNKMFITQEQDNVEKLVHEEEKHAKVLGNILQMLDHANEWLESAKFNHNKPY